MAKNTFAGGNRGKGRRDNSDDPFKIQPRMRVLMNGYGKMAIGYESQNGELLNAGAKEFYHGACGIPEDDTFFSTALKIADIYRPEAEKFMEETAVYQATPEQERKKLKAPEMKMPQESFNIYRGLKIAARNYAAKYIKTFEHWYTGQIKDFVTGKGGEYYMDVPDRVKKLIDETAKKKKRFEELDEDDPVRFALLKLNKGHIDAYLRPQVVRRDIEDSLRDLDSQLEQLAQAA